MKKLLLGILVLFSLSASAQVGDFYKRKAFNPLDYGADSTGTVSSTKAFLAAQTAAKKVKGYVYVTGGNYSITRPNAGIQRGMDVTCDWIGVNNPVLYCDDNLSQLQVGMDTTVSFNIVANTDSTSRYLTLNSTTGLVQGDKIAVRIGQAAYDAFEPAKFYYADIDSVVSGTKIKLNRNVGYNLIWTAVTQQQRKIFKCINIVHNITIKGFTFKTNFSVSHVTESNINLQYGYDITVEDCSSYATGASLVLGQFITNLHIKNVHVFYSSKEGVASKGRGLTFGECENLSVENYDISGFEAQAIVLEALNLNAKFANGRIYNTFSDSSQPRDLIMNLGNNEATFDGLIIGGYKSRLFNSSQALGKYIFRNITIDDGAAVDMNEQYGVRFEGYLSLANNDPSKKYYNIIRGEVQTYKLDNTSTAQTFTNVPTGKIKRITMYLSNATNIAGIYPLNQLGNGFGDITNASNAGKTFELAGPFNIGTSQLSTDINNGGDLHSLVIYKSAATSASDYLTLKYDYYETPNTPLLTGNLLNVSIPISAIATGTPNGTKYIRDDGTLATPSAIALANPTGLIGMTAVNGSSTSGTRSDGHSAIDPAITPQWTAQHSFNSGFPEILLNNATSNGLAWNYGSGGGGAIEGQFSGVAQFQWGINNNAQYAGTGVAGSSTNGRNQYWFDRVANLYRMGLNATGTFLFGADSINASVRMVQPGVTNDSSLYALSVRIGGGLKVGGWINNPKFIFGGSIPAAGTMVYFNSDGRWSQIAGTTNGQDLQVSGGFPTFGALSVNVASQVTGLLPVANGGTGTSSPGLVAGTNVTITGTWPNQTINASGGGSGISGLTTNTVPKATSGTAIGNSSITDNGSVVTVTEPSSLNSAQTGMPSANSAMATYGNPTTFSSSWAYGLLHGQAITNMTTSGGYYSAFLKATNNSSNTGNFIVGVHGEATTATNMAAVEGIAGVASVTNTSGTTTISSDIRGGYFGTTTSGSGSKTIAQSAGIVINKQYQTGTATVSKDFGIKLDFNTTAPGASNGDYTNASITDHYGLYWANPGGTITNKYAIYLESPGSSQYSIYSAGGKVKFGEFAGNGAGYLAISNSGDLSWSSGTGSASASIVATSRATGLTTAPSATTYTTANDGVYHTYRYSASTAVTTGSGGSTKIRTQGSYTDENGNTSQVLIPFNPITGLMTGLDANTVGVSVYSPIIFTAAPNTVISMNSTLSGLSGAVWKQQHVLEILY